MINESESVCNACMKKYGIGTFDNSKDGCGCDCWQGQIIEAKEKFQHKNRYKNNQSNLI